MDRLIKILGVMTCLASAVLMVLVAQRLLNTWSCKLAVKPQYEINVSRIFEDAKITGDICVDPQVEQTQWIAEDHPEENDVWQIYWRDSQGGRGRLLIQLVRDYQYNKE